MRINVRDAGAKGDGSADDTQAFVSALASIDASIMSLPNGEKRHVGGVLDVPGGCYRITSDLLLHERVRLRCERGAVLWFEAGGLVLDSGGSQAHAEVEVDGGRIYSTHGGVGFLANGGGYSVVSGAAFAGWDVAVRLHRSNGITVRDCVLSGEQATGAQTGIGVEFTSDVGGACNGNLVERVQFNGRSIGARWADGAGNVVRNCNFNACGEVARIEQAWDPVLDGQAEGVTGDCYVRIGAPGGYPQGHWSAQTLSISGHFSRNEPGSPAAVRFEKNAGVYEMDVSGLQIAGYAGAALQCAAPWPEIAYVPVWHHLRRAGLRIAGSTFSQLRPWIADRDLAGIDHGW